ncbi:neighbor of COX4-like protein [Syncephalis fuscata]|nr:neighbor of COX4-like protein [Syncephalis fuscata]
MSSSTPATYTVSRCAYAKIVLHVAAHACSSVNGVLLATTSSLKTSAVAVTDVVPLFHTRLNLSPMLEIALEQLDIYCEKTGQTIIGYYQANEMLDSTELSLVGTHIANRIREYQPEAFAVVVDNNKLSTTQPTNALIFHTARDGQWVVARNQPNGSSNNSSADAKNPQFQLGSSALDTAAAAVTSQAHRLLVDFDTHLTAINADNADWLLNDKVTAKLTN